ncbi:uncharacterized protein LOC129942611 [Eupeodes corollae]|uniref:uncharacterized protein LOC129942611 n=1 Tax=Eupeodes corollae TaxID=290404 RepID=UPI0024924AC8|nr:uncharacterized protein LOC129942611 [Eupeodes corollae]
MSDNLTKKESQLLDTIRQQFQAEGGVYDEIKCQLQHRLVQMMRGNENKTDVDDKAANKRNHKNERIVLVNQLIMEYLHWYQLNYSAEMFAMETQMDCNSWNSYANRELIEAALGKFQEKEIPILLEIVLNLWKKDQESPAKPTVSKASLN